MRKNSGRENRGVVSSILCAGLSMLICVMLIAGMAQLQLSQKLGQGSTEIIITGILLLSSLIGNWVSIRLSPKNALHACLVTTATIVGTMIIGGLTVDGQFQNVWMLLGAVIAGGAISCMMCLKKPSKAMRMKKRYR